MRRGIAITWHLVSFLLAAVLYFVFVLPRWWELLGTWPHGLGTAMRIVTGLVFASAAVPVALTLRKTARPEFRTPQLALTLRLWSIIGQVAAGTLIVATAVAEIWLDLDSFGRGLFAIYGAAAALALLGATAFYLAYAAELPPPPPKPLKTTRKSAAPEPATEPESEATEAEAEAPETEDEVAETEAAEDEAAEGTEAQDDTGDTGESDEPAKPKGVLLNKRQRKN